MAFSRGLRTDRSGWRAIRLPFVRTAPHCGGHGVLTLPTDRTRYESTGRFSVPSPGVRKSIFVGTDVLAVCQTFCGTNTNDPGSLKLIVRSPSASSRTSVAAPESNITNSSPAGCRSQVGQGSENVNADMSLPRSISGCLPVATSSQNEAETGSSLARPSSRK